MSALRNWNQRVVKRRQGAKETQIKHSLSERAKRTRRVYAVTPEAMRRDLNKKAGAMHSAVSRKVRLHSVAKSNEVVSGNGG
jgi:predicted Holliday junction resolvase-like endonuclease